MGKLFSNLPAKFMALLAALILWYQLREREPLAVRTLTRPVEVVGLPQGLSVRGLPRQVVLQVRGPARLVQGSSLGAVFAYIDFSGVQAGEFVREIQVGLPVGVQQVSLEPARVEGIVERLEARPIPVLVQARGAWIETDYKAVKASGPSSLLQRASLALGVYQGGADNISLVAVDTLGVPMPEITLVPSQVRVVGQGPILSEKTVPLVLPPLPAGLRVAEAEVPRQVTLLGSPDELARIREAQVRIPARPGVLSGALSLNLPPGISVVGGVTGRIRVVRVQ